MEYVSSRNRGRKVASAYAIANGLSPEGGLYCPESFPKLTTDELESLCKQSYKQRVAFVLGKFLTDFTSDELSRFAGLAYADEKFGGGDTAPLVALKDDTYMLELWHGPTCAFKDMALQMLPHLLTASLDKTGETRTACILVATSGDTGKAALDGFKDVPGTKMMVYYPEDGVSAMQKLQMTTQEGANIDVVAIRGNFDDAQSAVKLIFTDEDTMKMLHAEGMMMSSANSINWGRLAPQIAYYVSAYCDMVERGNIHMGDTINVCVPTGNFGNILAAFIAKQMGLPIAKFICASNRNNVLTDFFKTGTYDRNRDFYTTTSPSMDILISSNLERLLFILSDGDDEKVKTLMEQLASDGKYTVDAALFEKMNAEFAGGYCDDAMAAATIRQMFFEQNYLVDPHTAVAMRVLDSYRKDTGDTTATVVASTASPFKFCRAVIEALGGALETDDISQLAVLTDMTGVKAPAPLQTLADKTVRFTDVVDKKDILETVNRLKDL